jgi:type I restriction enzyme S subunit
MARLGDIATYINGYAFKPSDWSDYGVPIIRIQDLTGNSYQANRYNGEYEKKYEVLPGDVLISWSASLGIYVWTGEKAVLNQHIFKVVFDKCEVDKSFFVHQVQNILKKAESSAHGATMKHLTKPVFDALPFYLPPLEEQRRIAALLDKVSDLIAKRQAQLDKLDLLVKSRFVEMFGDPEGNNLGVSLKPMTEICTIIDGDRGKNYPAQDEFTPNGYCLFLNAKNVTTNGFSFENCMFITKEKDELLRKGHLDRGDIILTTRGTIGNLAFYDDSVPYENVRINSGMVILRMNHDLVSERFFIEQFKILLSSIKEKIASGSAQPQLPISTMNKIMMLIPAIEQQKEFSRFIEQIEKSKLTIQQSLDKLETLKKALMQQYFG